MEVCDKQSNDAHHYRKRCSNLEIQLQEVQVVSEQWRMEAIEKVRSESMSIQSLGLTALLGKPNIVRARLACQLYQAMLSLVIK